MINFTEKRNSSSMNLDQMSADEIALLFNQEDQTIPNAINEAIPEIVALTEAVIKSFKRGGRLIYMGAGTSGRLGILDAVECVPTFGTSPEMVVGLIAGGEKAMIEAVEGAEDSESLAEDDLRKLELNSNDILVGIAASGRTPYVIGGLNYAKKLGVTTGSISNNRNTPISKIADHPIEVVTGPEVLTGSTRLKAGTAQKQVLNMISTISMVKIGKAYENLMVDVQATNEKLVDRSIRIIVDATGVECEKANEVFQEAKNVKLAIVMILANTSSEPAVEALESSKGFVREAIEKLQTSF